MDCIQFPRLIACLLLVFTGSCAFSAEENFLLINGLTSEVMLELGPHVNECVSPASTFKIALSLMGYDAGILKDKTNPTWAFQEGYMDDFDSWKAPQSPQSWIKNSCVWYSQILASQLGLEKIQKYLAVLDYGNQDMSGGLTTAWLSSSLKISPRGQVDFIQSVIHGKLPISSNAIRRTKELLLVDELSDAWKLFGKTGMGSISEQDGGCLILGWFVGWVEKEGSSFPFAYNVRDTKISPAQRIQRVKQLLMDERIL